MAGLRRHYSYLRFWAGYFVGICLRRCSWELIRFAVTYDARTTTWACVNRIPVDMIDEMTFSEILSRTSTCFGLAWLGEGACNEFATSCRYMAWDQRVSLYIKRSGSLYASSQE